MRIDHVGFITADPEVFESFWCDVLGYQLGKEGIVSTEQAKVLFGYEGCLGIRRYVKENVSPDIEIHFALGGRSDASSLAEDSLPFSRVGMNHLCLHLGQAGSRQKLLESLPSQTSSCIFANPKGWQTIFIRDYEGNWIELREDLR